MKSTLSNLKHRILPYLVFCLVGPVCLAQWTLDTVVTIQEIITSQSIDLDNEIYIGTNSGNLYRYDCTGTELSLNSLPANFPVTCIVTWNRLRLFTFHQGSQDFIILNRFNTSPVQYQISDFQPELATICTPGIDNSIWMLSSSYHELRKYNLTTKQLQLSTPLRIDLSAATFMRIIQNLLVIADPKTGLYIFDQFGNEVRHVAIEGISYFQVKNKNLLFLTGDTVVEWSLNTGEIVKTTKAPKEGFRQVIWCSDRYFFIGKNLIEIYQENH